ncbi:hypothetical protein [Phyllobacterium myrsinacearum]|uniref:Uncharacterized protein n=1 Tax=Phyllobacterium myrsinacearum TaxID=28101 RepID=A0A839EE64_9HYPH|nr:hypothetical protein [Phyllobacterium myrsinacearum]MBA8876615.1 hypothetical protein [Phyllobacterium myrsinacearum]
MTYAIYRRGAPHRPSITHDNGFLDKFARRAPTTEDRMNYARWRAKLELGESIQGVPGVPHNNLPDALAAYRHFLDGSGSDRTFGYERYVANDPSGQVTLQSAMVEAMGAAYDIHTLLYSGADGVFQFTGTAIACGGTNSYFPYPKTENWQKAIGAHQIWISGDVKAKWNAPANGADFEMTFVLHAEDRYNFNPGAADIATGIPDSDNGIFEITGLAKQYMNYSTLERHVSWTGKPAAGFNVSMVPWLRQMQPSDNRRARNRI